MLFAGIGAVVYTLVGSRSQDRNSVVGIFLHYIFNVFGFLKTLVVLFASV